MSDLLVCVRERVCAYVAQCNVGLSMGNVCDFRLCVGVGGRVVVQCNVGLSMGDVCE